MSYSKTTPPSKDIQLIIKKIKTTKEGLKTSDILSCLSKQPNFLGVFAQDVLENICVVNFPFCIVVNLDSLDSPGSHWLSLYIDRMSIEIFDSLGFKAEYWPVYPIHLIFFIKRYIHNSSLKISQHQQSPLSNFCGIYSVYYILNGHNKTFEDRCKSFSTKFILNDDIELYSLTRHIVK